MTAASGSAMMSLREETRGAHESVDREIGRRTWLSSPSAYASFLDRTLRFHRIVDRAVAPVARRIDGLDYAGRRRIPLLQRDLDALVRAGVFPHLHEEHSAQAPPLLIGGPGAALGCLYVVEGATLGATVLARWIESRLGYDRHRGASSFTAYPGATMSRWRAFGALVEARVASAPQDRAVMVAAAQATFAVHHAVVVDASRVAEAVSA